MPRPPSPEPTLGTPFSRLYRDHGALVRRALRQLGVPPSSLEDATQDVFVVLHRRAAEFDRDRSLKNWLWGIARGVASTYRRGDRRRRRLVGELPRERAADSLDRELARGEAVGILDRFLGALDPDKCAVFVLSEIEGKSGPEISQMLEVNVNTVYARLRSARRCFHDAVSRHHVADARPLFASWLPLMGWSRGAAALAGSGALAVALALPAAPEVDEPVVELAIATIPDAPAEARRVAPVEDAPVRTRATISPAPVEAEIDTPASEAAAPAAPIRTTPAQRRARVRRTAEPPTPVEPTVVAPPSTPAEMPPERPWGEHIVARAPSSEHAPLIEMKSDFVDTLHFATEGL
jgi:RNA polymerase sigma-70 factor (ECF subfamily)